MIDSIRGVLRRKTVTEVAVDLGGIALLVGVPSTVFERLGPVGSEVELVTHLHVREDALQLYGFLTLEERSLFVRLLECLGLVPSWRWRYFRASCRLNLRRWWIQATAAASPP